ncbi:MAG: hypothetical protein BroJett030_27090 [Alphaproteobacteria bacterium]|nr:MAG: hypothetical protein BroJett030_27090 [Alphaproteobacteria bacterium]
MNRYVVDTNVPIVANGVAGPDHARLPSISCRIRAVDFLRRLLGAGTILLDLEGLIQQEYRRHLSPRGQPGVGDRFYREVLNSAPNRVQRVHLPRRPDGEYVDLPQSLIDKDFDPSDRKFAALARREKVPVVNATDSDWLDHARTLADEGILVENLCGSNREHWFGN